MTIEKAQQLAADIRKLHMPDIRETKVLPPVADSVDPLWEPLKLHDFLKDWWVVIRHIRGTKWSPVAMFPKEGMAREWIEGAPHRKGDKIQPLNPNPTGGSPGNS